MNSIKFSVVIPAYNNSEYLGEAIQSVLNQTYPNFELIVVNDASPDNTLEVVNQFHDRRLIYIVHDKNRGLSAARNTGILASRGDWIALLDGDDYFHLDKLNLHEEFIANNPGVGVTYNPRYELNHSAKTIRDIWRPPLRVYLSDLVQGFPFGPSDMVVKKEWMFRVGLFDNNHTYVGEDLDINCRLALAGCIFLSVDKALNYRRYYSGRILKNLRSCIQDTIRPLDSTFHDKRCPQNVILIRDIAYSQHYILWSIIAFLQKEIDLGQENFLKAISYNPGLLLGKPSRFTEIVTDWCIMDTNAKHEELIKYVLDHLPPDFYHLKNELGWAVARGFFLKGIREIIWGTYEDAYKCIQNSYQNGFMVNEEIISSITRQIQNYEHEFGREAALSVLNQLTKILTKVGLQKTSCELRGSYFFNRAFQSFQEHEYQRVPKEIGQAFANRPRYFTNRGAISILLRSITRFNE